MKLEQQCISLDIAKRLKELGVKQETFFGWSEISRSSGKNWEIIWDENESLVEWKLAAFTTAELGDSLPTNLYFKKRSYWLNIARWSHGWSVGYKSNVHGLLQDNEIIDNTLANALGKMLIYLLENHLMTLEAKK